MNNDYGGAVPSVGTLVGTTWNHDFILDSAFQYSYKGTGVRNTILEYCDQWRSELKTTDQVAKKLTTMQGFNGTTKCTYLLVGRAAFGAPAFEITKADYQNF